MNRSVGRSSLEVVHGYKPNKHINLIPMMHNPKISESASTFASHIHDLQKKISKKIQESNAYYKSYVDLYRMNLEFNEGNSVMIRI